MKYAAFAVCVVAAVWPASGLAQTNECKNVAVADCRKELTTAGWKHQLVKEADPKMADASVEYDVWMRGDNALFCIRSYWRGNIQGSMNCSPLKAVSN